MRSMGFGGVTPICRGDGLKPDDETKALRVSAPPESRPSPLGFVGLVSLDDPPDEGMPHHILRGEIVETDALHPFQDPLRIRQPR